MPTGKHSNWTHLCVFLGLDIGFDARRWCASHAALMDCVLADWGKKKMQFKKRWNIEGRKEDYGLSNVFVKAVLKELVANILGKTASMKSEGLVHCRKKENGHPG